MQSMPTLLMLAFCCLVACSPKTTGAAGAEKAVKFPEDWQGRYYGQAQIVSTKGVAMEVPMELHIEPTDTAGRYKWVIVYGEGEKRQVRDYRLVTVDAAKGTYVVDEGDGIQLHSFLIGNHLYSRFAVMGTDLLSDYERIDERRIDFTIITSTSDSLTRSGGTSPDVPPVLDYQIRNIQHGLLVKK